MTEFIDKVTNETSKIEVEYITTVTTIEDDPTGWRKEQQQVRVKLPNGTQVWINVDQLCDRPEQTKVLVHKIADTRTVLFHGKDEKVRKNKRKLSSGSSATTILID